MSAPLNPNDFSRREAARLQDENRRLQQQLNALQNLVKALDNLFNAADLFEDDSELMPFLRQTLHDALKLMNAPDGSLLLLDDAKDELAFVIVEGALSDQLTNHRIPVSEGLAGWAVRHGRPAMVRDVRTDPRFSAQVDQKFGYHTQSVAVAPLMGDQRVFGVIEVINQRADAPFSEDDVALLKLLCRAAGEALADMERKAISRSNQAKLDG